MNTERFDKHMAQAQDLLDAGFKSKAAKKRAMDAASSAMSEVRSEIQSMYLDQAGEGTEEQRDVYYAQPNGATFQKFLIKAEKAFADHDLTVLLTAGEQAAALYALAKAAPICPPVRLADTVEVRAEAAVQKSIMAMLEERRAKYDRCLHLDALFGKMGITANVHMVHGHKGTVFLRAFYYSLGVLTPLQVIIAAMEEAKRRELAAS